MAKANKPKTPAPSPSSESVDFSVTITPNGSPFVQWTVKNNGKQLYASGLRRKVDDQDNALAAWETGYPAFYGPLQGAFLDVFASCNPPLTYSNQRRPVSGDNVTYFYWAALGDAQNHVIVQGGPVTIVLP